MPGETPNKCAVLYIRVATNQQHDETAADRQREACQRIADKFGLTVVHEYFDTGVPARLDRQYGLRVLLDDLQQFSHAQFVVVWDYARLARDMDQLDAVTRRIRACGAEIVTIKGVEVARRHHEFGGRS